jgi:serine/threonine protein kinase
LVFSRIFLCGSYPEKLFKRLMLARDIAKGMTWLHATKIVHGDLKPANVLVCTSFSFSFNIHLLVTFRLIRLMGSLQSDFGFSKIKHYDFVDNACAGTRTYYPPNK